MVKTRQRGVDSELSNANAYTVETRSKRKKTLPHLVETISQISDSDDTEYRLPRKRRQRDLTPNDEKLSKYGKRNAVSSTITRLATRQHVHLGDDSDHQLPKNDQKIQSGSSHSCNNHLYMNGNLKNAKAPCVRRSPRQRKLIYDNLNQTWLLASSIPDLAKFDNLFSSNKKINRDVEKISSKGIETRRSYELRKLGLSSPDIEFDDMYSRVKRQRRKTVRDLYARRISRNTNMTDSEETDQNESMDDDEGGSDLEGSGVSGEEESQGENHPKYCLRPKKPITERFQFPIEPVRQKKSSSSQLFHSSSHIRHRGRHLFRSPAHKSSFFKRKHHAVHNSSSTCTSSDDERHFEQRKARSMARARNRCLPMNFTDDDLKHGVLRDRNRIGCSLADIDPMNINKSIMFDSIGGLDHHIRSLKEMIIFPLLYPEVFEKFKITPPRGVLFHGPPGTGKTLVARALANECSQGDRRIAFFMRKGADCLSKWVGESERQLRLLFDQAYSMRPSIIFFDEIDGLAPVRSTRQDQIHSSIVSTLLALMDGLDSRGEIVIIGATNRIDAIDPALRRPGRFDRELHFPLPSLEVNICF
ncbi:ATPase family AAA domain-containing protein 2B-like [Centruroides sculpturatus]|uniref:ATPase family AAA domain-containing protein 2B-like n=1 Tax=Centruroides sculpturatus TaxID=218467 RepID=UPI000C6CD306|nr:ATPase family AAA domain-containing protein 2B-like [Centruroides sculpturatus]